MTKPKLKLLAGSFLLVLTLFPASDRAAQVTCTDWEMHEDMKQNI